MTFSDLQGDSDRGPKFRHPAQLELERILVLRRQSSGGIGRSLPRWSEYPVGDAQPIARAGGDRERHRRPQGDQLARPHEEAFGAVRVAVLGDERARCCNARRVRAAALPRGGKPLAQQGCLPRRISFEPAQLLGRQEQRVGRLFGSGHRTARPPQRAGRLQPIASAASAAGLRRDGTAPGRTSNTDPPRRRPRRRAGPPQRARGRRAVPDRRAARNRCRRPQRAPRAASPHASWRRRRRATTCRTVH